MKRGFCAFCLLVFCTTGLAGAQDIGAGVFQSFLGPWLVAPVGGAPGCSIRLLQDQALGGYYAKTAQPCDSASPLRNGLAVWNVVEGEVILLSPARKVLARLREQEGGPYRGQDYRGGALVMARVADGIDHMPQAQEALGLWDVVNPQGQKLCNLLLQDHKPDGSGPRPLAFQGRCTKPIDKLNFASWAFEDFSLVLYNQDGEGLALDARGPNDFATPKEFRGPAFRVARP